MPREASLFDLTNGDVVKAFFEIKRIVPTFHQCGLKGLKNLAKEGKVKSGKS